MSLDAKTLTLLTAKDHALEIEWFDAESFTYLHSSIGGGFELIRQSSQQKDVLAEGLASPLAYSGRLYTPCPDIHFLRRDGKLCRLDDQTTRDLPGPSTDLNKKAGAFYLIVESSGENEIYRSSGSTWKSLFRTKKYLRHLSLNPKAELMLALSWPKGELPWFAAELVLIAEDGRSQVLHPPELNSPCSEAEFSPSGDCLVASFLTDEYNQLWLYKLATKNWVQLTFDQKEHATPLRRSSRRTFTFIRDGLLAYTASDKSFWRIDTLDYSGHGHKIATPFTFLQNPRAHPQNRSILGFGASLDYPYGPMQLKHNQSTWLAEAFGQRLPASPSLKAERISWSSINGETIHGILYRDSALTQPAPLIMPVHGGPTEAVQATWPSKALAFVRQGYAVFYVNYRGSYGYGISYLQKLEGGLGQIEVNDLVSGVKSLSGSGWIDSSRVGLWGGGTASLTVLRALAAHPEVFAAGVAVFPILNLLRHLSLCSEPERTELLWALGSDDPERLKQLSAISTMDSLSRPLGLFAGAEDKLIDQDELRRFVDALKARKVPCWLTLYENEARTWRKTETYSDYYSKVAGFFDRFLKFRSET